LLIAAGGGGGGGGGGAGGVGGGGDDDDDTKPQQIPCFTEKLARSHQVKKYRSSYLGGDSAP
jgi:hypothetical protein